MSTDYCPWLGTEDDSEVHHAEPFEQHICYAQEPPAHVALGYQARNCLTPEHRACPHYRPPADFLPPAPHSVEEQDRREEEDEDEAGPPPAPLSRLRLALWAAAILAFAVLIAFYASNLLKPPVPRAPSDTPQTTASPRPTPALTTPAPTPPPAAATLEPTSAAFLQPSPTPTPHPGGAIYSITPRAEEAGWVASDESRGNHLGDSYLYSGVFDGVVYHGVFRLDLSAVPRGATIHLAVLELTGLDDRRLGQAGNWEVRILERASDARWAAASFQDIHNATVQWTLLPALGVGDLAPSDVNAFALSAEQIKDLEQRLLDSHFTLSFRLDGPLSGENSVFAWDSGYGPATRGARPRLLLSVGAAPQTPVPTGTSSVVVVTSTPTPANVLTAMAMAQTATAIVEAFGPPTPTSIYQWTATPVNVVTGTPTPATQATADYYAALATAIAFTTGTFTPTPTDQVTATPTPLAIPFEQLTPTPTPTPPPPTPPVPSGLVGKILFQSDRAGKAGPWAMEPDGRGVSLLTAPWPYAVAAGQEAFSPDRASVVYAGWAGDPKSLGIRRLDGSSASLLFTLVQGEPSAPVWSPAGDLIAFVSVVDGRSQVWLVGVSGTDLRQLTLDAQGTAGHPSFSPDGTRLVYSGKDTDGRRQIWVIGVDGSGLQRISDGQFEDWDPVWVK